MCANRCNRQEGSVAAQGKSGRMLDRRRDAHEQLWHSLERTGIAMAQLDTARRPVRSTAAMDRLLERADPLRHRAGRITGASGEIEDVMDWLLEGPATNRRTRDVIDTRGRPWRLTVVRHRAAHPFSAGMQQFTLLVQHRPDEVAARAALNKRFGLTPAESRCLLALPEFGDVPSLARAFEVSPETIRSHLRSVFAKTGTGSQAELMLLLAREGLIGGE